MPTDLETLLAPLPESQREVIEMLKVEGMSLEEVARATSSSVGSVKQKAHRAYKKLRETMSATGIQERAKRRTVVKDEEIDDVLKKAASSSA